MLVLTRKLEQQIQIGENITVTILEVKGKVVRVGISAPREIRVLRAEIAGRPPRVQEPATRLPGGGSTDFDSEDRETDTHFAADDAIVAAVRETLAEQAGADLTPHLVRSAPVESLPPGGRRWVTSANSSAPLIRPPSRLGPTSLRGLVAARRR